MGLAPFASQRYRNLRVVEQDECPGDGLDVDKMMLTDEILLHPRDIRGAAFHPLLGKRASLASLLMSFCLKYQQFTPGWARLALGAQGGGSSSEQNKLWEVGGAVGPAHRPSSSQTLTYW